MPSVKIALPKKFIFSTQLTLRVADMNYGGHLGSDTVLTLTHEARLRFLKHYGYNEQHLEGIGLIMANCAVVYQSQGLHGDVIAIEVAIDNFTHCGFDFFYRLTNTHTGKALAHAQTGMVCFDYPTQKIRPTPQVFKALFIK